MSTLVKPEGSSCRFYNRTGEPRYDVTIREARKEGLLPSVTSIIGLWPKFALEAWKIEQGIMAALTLPRLPNEPLDAFARRVVADGQAQVRTTADWGGEFHGLCEALHREPRTEPTIGVPERMKEHFRHYCSWFHREIVYVKQCEETVANLSLGYAGRFDLYARLNSRFGLGDIKSRSVKNGKPTFYETQIIQLVAYGKCLDFEPDVYFSVIVNRDKAEPPYVKYWTTGEAEAAWQDFLSLLLLWQRVNRYDPTKPKDQP